MGGRVVAVAVGAVGEKIAENSASSLYNCINATGIAFIQSERFSFSVRLRWEALAPGEAGTEGGGRRAGGDVGPGGVGVWAGDPAAPSLLRHRVEGDSSPPPPALAVAAESPASL